MGIASGPGGIITLLSKTFRFFSVLSALAFILTVIVLAFSYRYFAVNELIHSTEERNIEYARIFSNELSPLLEPLLGPGPHDNSSEVISLLDAEAEKVASGSPILKVKFYSLDGLTVYSSEHSQIGESKKTNAGFLDAVNNFQESSELSMRDKFSAFSKEVFNRDVVETYVPIKPTAGSLGKVVEVYTDVTALSDRIKSVTYIIIALTSFVLSLLYIFMFYIVLRAGHALRQQVTALEKSESALRTAHQELENANQVKSIFLRTISHELRTPLNAIIGFSDILVQKIYGPLNNAKYEEYANDIHVSSRHLLGLINNVLDLSSLEAGKRDLSPGDLDLRDAFDDCTTLVSELASAGGVEISVTVSSDISPIYADAQALRQILVNLLSNAIKFTPSGGRIHLEGHSNDTEHVISVSDTGPGIPPNLLQEITRPFVTTVPNSDGPQTGTGLGLSIVKALMALHEGSLEIESELGQGTKVTLKFPSTFGQG